MYSGVPTTMPGWVRRCGIGEPSGDAQVGNFEARCEAVDQEQVGRLDVAMDDPGAVERGATFEHLQRYRDALESGEPLHAQPSLQRVPLQPLHRE